MNKKVLEKKLIKQFKLELKKNKYDIYTFEEIEAVIKYLPDQQVKYCYGDLTIDKPIDIPQNIKIYTNNIYINSPNVSLYTNQYIHDFYINSKNFNTFKPIVAHYCEYIIDYLGDELDFKNIIGAQYITLRGVNNNLNIKNIKNIKKLWIENSKLTSYDGIKSCNIQKLILKNSIAPDDLSTLPEGIKRIDFTNSDVKELGNNKHELLEVEYWNETDKVIVNDNLKCRKISIPKDNIKNKTEKIDIKEKVIQKITELLSDIGIVMDQEYVIKDLTKWGDVIGNRNRNNKVVLKSFEVSPTFITIKDEKSNILRIQY